MSLLRKLMFSCALVMLCATAYAADKRASFGFGTDAKTSGYFLNPTLERVWISKVTSDSPAERAGLLVGDVIIAANEKPIPGSSAKMMSSLLRSFKPGDHLHLKVERAGKIVVVEIIAGAK